MEALPVIQPGQALSVQKTLLVGGARKGPHLVQVLLCVLSSVELQLQLHLQPCALGPRWKKGCECLPVGGKAGRKGTGRRMGEAQNFQAWTCGLFLVFLVKNGNEAEQMERSRGRKQVLDGFKPWS